VILERIASAASSNFIVEKKIAAGLSFSCGIASENRGTGGLCFVLRFDSDARLLGQGLASGLLLAEFGPSALFAGFFVVLVGAQFFLHATAFDELFEPAKSLPDRFFIVDPHPKTHSSSRFLTPSRPGFVAGRLSRQWKQTPSPSVCNGGIVQYKRRSAAS